MKRILAYSALMLCINHFAAAQVIIPADSLKKHVFILASDSLEGRGFATKSGLEAAKYIAGYFEKAGLKTVGGEFLHPFEARCNQTMLTGNNVVGIVEGSDSLLKDEFIVLGAHYDHVSYMLKDGEKIVYNGADDNATGVSAIIELARAIAVKKPALKRTVVFVAFDGEENGLLGSYNFVNQSVVPINKVKLMMSFDMIGRFAESQYLEMEGTGSLVDGEEMLKLLADSHGIRINKSGAKISDRTDTKPFGDAGIPSIHVTSGIIGPYHKPEDDPETIDYEGMSDITGLLYDLTVVISNSSALLSVRQLTNQARNGGIPFFRYGFIANIGSSYHRYPEEFYNGRSKFSYEAGIMTQFKISKYISLQPEVLYSSLASDYSGPGVFRTHSVQVPVSLILATRMNRNLRQRSYLSFGAYYSYNFSGNINGDKLDFENTFNRSEKGLQVGIGMEAESVCIGVKYRYGLTGIMLDEATGEMYSRGAYFTIGYIF